MVTNLQKFRIMMAKEGLKLGRLTVEPVSEEILYHIWSLGRKYQKKEGEK